MYRACRRLHQAVARRPASQPASVVGLSSDHLHAIYRDLMSLEPTTTQPRVESSSKAVDGLLASYARRGNVQDFESAMSRMLSAPPTEQQRDLHVKAHIANASLATHSSSAIQHFPTSALAVLHQYEANGHVAPMKSYTRVISALFNVQTCPSSDPRLGRAAAQAQAWDLFAHMRYVAHPVPDAHLYALMIRACGSFSRPEPERALDLWAEMQENGIVPTKGAYEAVIRVCGRAGLEWIGEGLRLAREMSDRHSVSGVDGRGLWCALLEGCKRAGDLKRARWILAEAVRGGAKTEDAMVNAELMTHMFHTYASYKPPFRRETTRLVHHTTASNGEISTDDPQTEETSSQSDPILTEPAQGDNPDAPIENIRHIPSFSRLPPQTSSDVIAESRALFSKFAHAGLTPVLLSAYLSVFYRHGSIEMSREMFDSPFSKSDSSDGSMLHPDEHTYVNALERCAIARVEDRHIATRWAADVWQRWEATEVDGLKHSKGGVGSFARLVERAHAAMRRVLLLSGDIDGALMLLRTFVSRYPPNAVLRPPSTSLVTVAAESTPKPATPQLFSKPYILSTRTVLANPLPSTARPLVRLTSAVLTKDDRIPPTIAFDDVDLLHARLAEHGRIKDLGYLKWVCMAYANALKKRRNAVLNAKVD